MGICEDCKQGFNEFTSYGGSHQCDQCFIKSESAGQDGESVSLYGRQCEDCGSIPADAMTGRCKECEPEYLKKRGLA